MRRVHGRRDGRRSDGRRGKERGLDGAAGRGVRPLVSPIVPERDASGRSGERGSLRERPDDGARWKEGSEQLEVGGTEGVFAERDHPRFAKARPEGLGSRQETLAKTARIHASRVLECPAVVRVHAPETPGQGEQAQRASIRFSGLAQAPLGALDEPVEGRRTRIDRRIRRHLVEEGQEAVSQLGEIARGRRDGRSSRGGAGSLQILLDQRLLHQDFPDERRRGAERRVEIPGKIDEQGSGNADFGEAAVAGEQRPQRPVEDPRGTRAGYQDLQALHRASGPGEHRLPHHPLAEPAPVPEPPDPDPGDRIGIRRVTAHRFTIIRTGTPFSVAIHRGGIASGIGSIAAGVHTRFRRGHQAPTFPTDTDSWRGTRHRRSRPRLRRE